MEKLIDANVILRYLLQYPEDMAEKAKEVIMGGAFTTVEVVAEVVYVLSKVYAVGRNEIKDSLVAFMDVISLDNKEVVVEALEMYVTLNLDFVDCILASRAKLLGDIVFTFDKKLAKAINAIAEE